MPQPDHIPSAATPSPPLRFWHPCHHCDGRGCEVCEETKGWWAVDAVEYDAVRATLREQLEAALHNIDCLHVDEDENALDYYRAERAKVLLREAIKGLRAT